MLHPDPDAPDTLRSLLTTLLASIVVAGGFLLLFTDHDTAAVAMPEPPPPVDVQDDGARAPIFPGGMAALASDDSFR